MYGVYVVYLGDILMVVNDIKVLLECFGECDLGVKFYWLCLD